MSRVKLKLKKDDEVIVLTGKSKGQKGKITKAIPAANKVVVAGINMVTRHVKPSQANPQGGIIKQEMPIHVSNVALLDPKDGTATKVGYKVDGDKKVRIARKSGEVIDG